MTDVLYKNTPCHVIITVNGIHLSNTLHPFLKVVLNPLLDVFSVFTWYEPNN